MKSFIVWLRAHRERALIWSAAMGLAASRGSSLEALVSDVSKARGLLHSLDLSQPPSSEPPKAENHGRHRE